MEKTDFNEKDWQKIDAYTEREEKVQINPQQYAVRKIREPIEAYKYIGPENR